MKKIYVYCFVEYGIDFGSLKDVCGNLIEFFRCVGKGVLYGVGVKLGFIRIEYVRDCNIDIGVIFV